MEWVSVKKRVPEEKGQYICFIQGFEDSMSLDGWYNYIDIVEFGYKVEKIEYEEKRIIHVLSNKMDFVINSDGYISKEVTHWMELPKCPKEIKTKEFRDGKQERTKRAKNSFC